jgi:divinyl protochlorophyllide a 8-vinyl-reductase
MTMSLAHPSTFEGRADKARSHGKTVGRVGPNAAIQLLHVLPMVADPETVRRIIVTAGVEAWATHPPTDMIEERPAAALHRATRSFLDSHSALAVLAEAGSRTGDYLLANRIPVWARGALKTLPASVSSRLLARAIKAHAWTFIGSGRFVCNPGKELNFEIWSNPFCAGEQSDAPTCAWHAAVFARLYQALVSSKAKVVETQCSARGDACCRFGVYGIRR